MEQTEFTVFIYIAMPFIGLVVQGKITFGANRRPALIAKKQHFPWACRVYYCSCLVSRKPQGGCPKFRITFGNGNLSGGVAEYVVGLVERDFSVMEQSDQVDDLRSL